MKKNYDVWTGKGIEPCPKCGAKTQCTRTNDQGSIVFCWGCHHHGPVRKQEASAVSAWNKEAKKGKAA